MLDSNTTLCGHLAQDAYTAHSIVTKLWTLFGPHSSSQKCSACH